MISLRFIFERIDSFEYEHRLLLYVSVICLLLCLASFVLDEVTYRIRLNRMENQLRIFSAEIEESNKNWSKYKVKSKPAPSQIATLSAQARDPRLMSRRPNQLEQALAVPEAKQVSSASKSAIDRSEEIKERMTSSTVNCRQNATEDQKQLNLVSEENLNKYKVAPLSAPARDPRLMSQSNQLEQALAIPEAKQVSSANISAIDRSEEIKERVTSNFKIRQNVIEDDQKQLNLLSAEIEEKLKNLNKHEIKPAPSQIAPLSAQAQEPRFMSQSNQLKQALAIPEKVTAANLCKPSHVLPSSASLPKRIEPVRNIKKESQSRSTGSSLHAPLSKPAINAAFITDTSVKQEVENGDELEKIISQYSLHLGSELEKAPIKPSSSAYSIWSQEIITDIRDTLAVNLFRPCRTHEETENIKKMINPTQAFSLFDGNQKKQEAATLIQSTFRKYITKKRLRFIRRKTAFFDQISGQSGISIFGRMLDNKSGKFIPKSSNHAVNSPLGQVNNLAVIPWVPQSIPPSSHLSVSQWIQSHQSTAPLYPTNFTGKITSMTK